MIEGAVESLLEWQFLCLYRSIASWTDEAFLLLPAEMVQHIPNCKEIHGRHSVEDASCLSAGGIVQALLHL